MNNPILLSEGFERAAYALQRSLDNFGTGNFDQSVQTFERSVDKMARIFAMQAENDERKYRGEEPAHTYNDFHNA